MMRTTQPARRSGKVLQALLCAASLALATPAIAQSSGEIQLEEMKDLLERSQRALQDQDWETFGAIGREIEAFNARQMLEGQIEPIFALLRAHFAGDAALMRLIDEIKLRVVADRPAAEAGFDGIDAEVRLGAPLIFELSTHAATMAAGFYAILSEEELAKLDYPGQIAAWTEAIDRWRQEGGPWPRFGRDALDRLSEPYKRLAMRYSGDAADAVVAWIVLHELAHHALCHVGGNTARCAGMVTPEDRIAQEWAADDWATARAYDMGLSLEAISTGLNLFVFREAIRNQLRADAGLPPHTSPTHPAWHDRRAYLMATHEARGLNPDMLRVRFFASPLPDGKIFGGRIVTPHRCEIEHSMIASRMPLSFGEPDFAIDILGCRDDIWQAEPRRIEGWVGDLYMRIDVPHPHARLGEILVSIGPSHETLGDPFPMPSVLMAGATEVPQNVLTPDMLKSLQTNSRMARTGALIDRAGIPAPLRAGALEASRLCARSYNLTLHEIVTRSPPPSARTAEDFAAIERDIDMHRQVCDLALSKHLGPPWDARLKRASQTLFLESGALMPMLQP